MKKILEIVKIVKSFFIFVNFRILKNENNITNLSLYIFLNH